MPTQARENRLRKALISDDDEFFRAAIRSVLRERNGFSEVIETASFEEAVDKLGEVGPVDMGLFDLNMLGMDNWLDLSAVRGEFPGMRLVVVSASRNREDILRALECGAHGFIHKGLGICELSRAIDLIHDGQVYVPPFLPENAVASPPICFAHDAPLLASDPVQADREVPDAGLLLTSSDIKPLHCSPRQREVLDLLIAGHSNKAMARVLNLSEGTIKFHMSAVMRLLGANSRVEAATRAMKRLAG